MKILTVFGTRPEGIKMAALCNELTNNSKIDHKVCITGQHKEMLDQVLDFFRIKPDYDLKVMAPNQDLSDVTSKILLGIRDIIKNEFTPDVILVHGDTTSCFATSLAAFYQQIPIGHVEAGLRTWNLKSPFPEEVNRVLTDAITTYYFCPTELNRENLLKTPNIDSNKIIVTGNTVIDALLLAKTKISQFSNKVTDIKLKTSFEQKDRRKILVTGHRRENFGKGFEDICSALLSIAKQFPNDDIIYPVHLNPNVQEPVKKYLSNRDNIILTSPLEYPDFVYAMSQSYLILTDSGGIQEEAPSLGKPVLVMRDTTERPEAVEYGTVKLVGTDSETIFKGVKELLNDKELYKEMSVAHNPYGDGMASKRIVDFLLKS